MRDRTYALFARLLRPHRGQLFAATGIVLVASVLNAALPALIGAAIDAYLMPSSSSAGAFDVFHLPSRVTPMEGLRFAAAYYFLLVIAGAALSWTEMVVTNDVGQSVMSALRRAVFRRLQQIEVREYDRKPVGWYMTAATSDIDALNELFTAGFVALFSNVLYVAAIAVVLFATNVKLALVLLAAAPVILLVARWFRGGIARSNSGIRLALGAMSTYVQEHLSGAAVVRAFGARQRVIDGFRATNAAHRDAHLQSVSYYALFLPAVEMAQAAAIAAMLWYGGVSVLGGAVSLGVLTAFVAYAQRLYEPLAELAEKYNLLQSSLAASDRVVELLEGGGDAEPAVRDGEIELTHFESLELRDVWFAYSDEQWVLRGVSFTVRAGETVAFVGHTGAGKSTILSLLLRFYDEWRGEILVNGIDIRRVSIDSLRRLFALVPQDLFLVSDTVAENIGFSGTAVPAERIRAAVEIAGATEIVERRAGGFDAHIQEYGTGWSTGEKQLLNIARAVAADAPVLLLDEATASVDPETEQKIHRGREAMTRRKTSIVIAHRLATIGTANVIHVLHRGELRESGTHAQLLARNGLYSKLWDVQTLAGRVRAVTTTAQ